MSNIDDAYQTQLDDEYEAEALYDQELQQDFEESPATELAVADDPSWDAQEDQIAQQLDDTAEANFQTSLDQAASFDDILNGGY